MSTDVRSWPLDKPLPVLLRDAELLQVLGLSERHFYRLKKLGRFHFLEVTPQFGDFTRYSGAKVKAYLAGESTSVGHVGTFGRRTTRARQQLSAVPPGAVAVR